MSVPKNKRSQSKVEFEHLYYTLADRIDTMVEHNFYANAIAANENKIFLSQRAWAMSRLTDDLLYYIKIANSIYPQTKTEWEERRVAMDKAIGICFALLTHFQRVMMRLRVKDNCYTQDVMLIGHMINSLKSWRKSDNKLKENFKE